MPEEKTPQQPVSPQVRQSADQIKAPSFKDKLKLHKKKIFIGLGIFLGVLILVGAVFGAYKIMQTKQGVKPEESIKCTQDSDCILVVRLDQCCSCPKAISRDALKIDLNLAEYVDGKDYSQEKTVNCEGIECASCGPLPHSAVCFEGMCQIEGQTIIDETTDWETYTNEKYGYSIKFPPGWGQGIEIASFTKDGYSLTISPTPIELSRPPNITITTNKVKVGDRDYFKSTWKFSDGKISFERINLEREDNLEIVLMYKDGIYSKEYDQIFNLILSTFKFLEEGTPSPTPQLNHVPTLPTTDWKTVSNNGVSFKIPPGAICDNDNLCTKVTYTWDYQGHPISSYIYVGVSDYQGESRREKFLEKNTEVVDCRPIYEEALFGDVKVLQIAIENGYCQGSSGGVVVIVGNKLVIIGSGLGYDPETKVIDRWPVRDTIISTLRMQ